MAVRYKIKFKDYDNGAWQILISDNSVSATAVDLRGVKGAVCELSHDPSETDDPFSVFIKSTLSMSLYNQDNIDINELQNASDKDFKVGLYKNSTLKWAGYLKTDGIQRKLQSAPTTFQLEATDGLSLLNDIDYTHADLNGGRCPINYFRQILFSTDNLGLALPIRWTNTLRCTAYLSEDVFSGSVQWSTDDQGFYSYQASQSDGETGKIKKCGEILEEMLRSMQCRIYQADGMWKIRRVNDLVLPTIPYKQVAGNLGDLTVSSGTENLLKQIGRNGYPFLNKDAVITTKQGLKSITVQYEANVRENILPNGSQDIVTVSTPDDIFLYWGKYATDPFIKKGDSLFLRQGNSAFLRNFGSVDAYYTLKPTGGTFTNNGLPIDTQTVIKSINFSFLMSLHLNFPPDENGQIDWSGNPFLIQVIFNDETTKYYLNDFGFWTTDETFISIIVPGLKLDEVARINFDKFKNIIMPLPGTPPTAGSVSNIQVVFVVKPTQQYYIDDISINIEDGNDVYESIYEPSRNTSTDSRSLKISSSYGGYMISNFMSSWDKSGDECYFADGLYYSGTLTGLTANAMMRFRYKSSKIFNGTINVRNSNYSFDQVYLIDTFGTEKYLPLNARSNVETCKVFLVAIECRNDAINLKEKYYSSNDKTLSN